MTIQCPECGARYKLTPTSPAKSEVRVKCRRCLNLFKVSLDAAGQGSGLPSTGGATVPQKERSSSPREPAAGTKPASTVLVVDDSRFFRELIVDMLKPLSLSTLTAANGAEAMAVIRREHPALVILDLNLSAEKSGTDLVRDIRADRSLDGIRLLAMSGVFRKKADVAEVEMAGADDFISKSFTPEQLHARVINLLRH